jgi:hypothetical protein
MSASRQRLLLLACILIAAGVFFTGIDWGLPSRHADPYLFGTTRILNGGEIQAATEGVAAASPDASRRGADVDLNPRAPSNQPVRINPEHQLGAQAEIVRRYRLFSHQPDEMITFMALRTMRPAQLDFDPHLYQYGGLWIYPVALFLKVASALNLIDLRSGDPAYYLDRPEAFGRFYVVARAYVAIWGLIGVAAIFGIVRRISGSPWAAAGAAVAFSFMPVVVNMAHEAKPHLPGVVLVLLTVLAAARYVESGKLSYGIVTGALCGCAVGMVLSTLPVFSILPAMVLLRPGDNWSDRIRLLIFASLLGGVTYGVTNPYVVYHLAGGNPEPFWSNLGNSSTFYAIDRPLDGMINVGRLMVEGASPIVFSFGILATTILAARAIQARASGEEAEVRRRAHGLLLAAPALLTAIQWALVGADKPGEFGRFLLLTDVFLLVEAFVLLGTYIQPPIQTAAALIGVVVTGWFGWPYLQGFLRDRNAQTSRLVAAHEIEEFRKAGAKRVLVMAEPAPYAVPPLNLFDWEVILVPRRAKPDQYAQPGDVIVEVQEGDTPLSWADKPFKVRRLEPKAEDSGL